VDAAVLDYLDRSRDRQLAELVELVSFPSVSGSSEHGNALAGSASWLAGHLARIGLDIIRLDVFVRGIRSYAAFLLRQGP
jgi:acetylornithine deacetylase/succinyl-diaminopimelate desuccinylase-like protein